MARAGEAASGRPGVVWIEGEAGAGKTALLRTAVAALAADFRVVRAEADELASGVAFDVVAQLGVRDAAAPFPAGLELIGQWAGRPDGRPVLVAVEDLHWADAESRLALLTAARRLGEDRVLIVVTSRLDSPAADGWERLRFDGDRCLRVPVGPLSAAEVAEMARLDGVVLPPSAAERLRRHTGGLALYVRTLLSELSAGELEVGEGPLPVPRSLAAATTARLAELPRAARELAAALAVLGQRVPLRVAGAVAEAAEPAVALDSLLTTGFVTSAVSDGQIAAGFAHPLYRAAVYDDLAPSTRQRLHRMAGRVLEGDAALAHRVSATDGTDDALAQEAYLAARVEAERHHNAVAARYLLWAARLSSRRRDAGSRLLRAARLLIEAGHLGHADGLRPDIEACEPSPMRGYILGLLAYAHQDLPAAEGHLGDTAAWADRDLPGWETDLHREAVAAALARLALIYSVTGRPRESVDAAAAALTLGPKEPDVQQIVAISVSASIAVLDGPVAGLAHLGGTMPASPADVAVADVSLLVVRGVLRLNAGQLTAAMTDLRGAVHLAGRHPWDLASRAAAHAYLAQLLFHTGDWDEALAQARITLSLAFDEPQPWVETNAHATITWVHAGRGSQQEAARHLDVVRGLAEAWGTTESVMLSRITEAVCARARNEPAEVASQLALLAGIGGDGRQRVELIRNRDSGVGIIWWPWFVRALIDCGEAETAAGQLDQLEHVTAARQLDFRALTVGLRGALAASRGDREQAVALCREAVALAGPEDPVLDQADLHHTLGRLLAAVGDGEGAAAQLTVGHQLLADAGAEPFAERLAASLRLAELPRPRDASRRLDELTGRESDIAALAAKGLSSPEIAAELYVSVNTVEYHLRNVYTKLGIKSRRELRARRGQAPA